jgi:hypothetical protein
MIINLSIYTHLLVEGKKIKELIVLGTSKD